MLVAITAWNQFANIKAAKMNPCDTSLQLSMLLDKFVWLLFMLNVF